MNTKFVLIPLLLFVSALALGGDRQLTPEQIVEKSLDAIGAKQFRDAQGGRYLTGTVKLHQLSAGKTELEGPAFIMSESPNKIRLQMKFDSLTYPLEDFMFAGKSVEVATIQPRVRSRLGDFLFQRDPILRDGLLGGPLSAASALSDLKSRGAKLKYDGLKQLNGRQVHQVTYIPKKNSDDLKVDLFFDAETFQHVMTTYSWVKTRDSVGLLDSSTSVPGMTRPMSSPSTNMESNAGRRDYHYSLEERFEDFRKVGELTLPVSYQIRFSGDSGSGPATFLYELTWDHYNDAPISGK